MKKLLTTLSLLVFTVICVAQTTWTLDFGTNTGTFVISANGAIESTVSQSPNLDIPSPSPSSIPAQVVRFRMSSPSSGKFELANTGATIGSAARLKITAPTSTSSNKFSVYNIPSTSKVMSLSYKIRFDAGTNGEQIFSIGNNDGGAFYSNGSGMVDGGFASMQWNLGATKHSFSFFLNTTSNNSTTSISEALNPVIAGFTPNSEHTIEVYGNNTTLAKIYSKNSANYHIGAGKWQVWVDGTQLFSATGVTDFGAGVLGASLNLNAFAFNSKSSTTNAVTFLDDFVYSDFLPEAVMPISLASFVAQKQAASVLLKWNTASELNNAYFEVQRSTDGIQFKNIAKINGAGNSEHLLHYYFTDDNPVNGLNYYRLNQIDFDGKATLTDPVSVNMGFGNLTMEIYSAPNSSNINIGITADHTSEAQLTIYNIGGKKVLEQAVSLNKGANHLSLNMSDSNQGIFIATLHIRNQLLKKKFLK